MKHKKLGIPIILLFCTLQVLLPSCNSEKKKNQESVPVTNNNDTTAQKDHSANSFDGEFPYLIISKTDFDNLFKLNLADPKEDAAKLVFQFYFNDGKALPGLIVFPAKTVREFKPVPANNPVIPLVFTRPLPGPLVLGNLELSRAQYDIIKADPGYATANSLLLKPDKKGDNVVYQCSWSTLTAFSEKDLISIQSIPGGDFNPSPPARPEGGD